MKRGIFLAVTILLFANFSAFADESLTAEKFLNAHTLVKEKKFNKAITALEPLLKSPFILGDYVIYDIGFAYVKTGAPDNALTTLNRLAKEYPNSPLKQQANELRLVSACEKAGSKKCGKYLREIRAKNVTKKFRVKRDFIEAERSEALGKKMQAFKLYQKIYYDFPATETAEKARLATKRLRETATASGKKTEYPYATYYQRMKRANRLMKAFRYGDAVSDLRAAMKIGYAPKRKIKTLSRLGDALNRARKRDEAKKVFKQLIKNYPKSPEAIEAEYRIARIDWNLDKKDECVKRLTALLARKPIASIARQAYIILGRIAANEKRYDDAEKSYAKALSLKPDSQTTHELKWRMGWLKYQHGDFKKAGEYFLKMANKASLKWRDGGFLYWAAKSFKKAGELKKADKISKRLVYEFPHTYYGTRVMKNTDAEEIPAINIEQGFASVTVPTLDKISKEHLKRMEFFVTIGLPKEASCEVDAIARRIKKNEKNSLWLGTLYIKTKTAEKSIRLQVNMLGFRKLKNDFDQPFWRAFYPISHWETAAREAEKLAIDPFFIMSIMRQESAFKEDAISPANAMGLMQLMPHVGRRTYEKIDIENHAKKPFEREMLFDPAINISLGIAHMAELVSRYNGNIVFMAAAYNAGYKAVNIWRKRYGAIPDDEFAEMIPYRETRKYVKKVQRNLALYHRIYMDDPERRVNSKKEKI